MRGLRNLQRSYRNSWDGASLPFIREDGSLLQRTVATEDEYRQRQEKYQEFHYQLYWWGGIIGVTCGVAMGRERSFFSSCWDGVTGMVIGGSTIPLVLLYPTLAIFGAAFVASKVNKKD